MLFDLLFKVKQSHIIFWGASRPNRYLPILPQPFIPTFVTVVDKLSVKDVESEASSRKLAGAMFVLFEIA